MQETISTQICVVGSGPAGSIAATALAQKGINVLIIEAGTDEPDYDLSTHADKVDVSGQTDLSFGFSRQVGGATNLWAGRMAPLETIDFASRDWVPYSGWPLTRQELEPFYKEAARILGLSQMPDSIPTPLPSVFAGLQSAEAKRFLWAAKPFNAGDYLKKALGELPHLSLKTGLRAKQLACSDDGKKVKTLMAVDSAGQEIIISADIFIIAAGGIETPRLLLNSAGKASCTLGNDHDQVGRFFSTHPKADMAVLHLHKRTETSKPLFSDRPIGTGSERHGLGFSADQQRAHKLLNHYVQLSPLLEYSATKLFEKVKGAGALKSRFIDRSKIMKGLLPAIGLIVYEMIGRLAGWQKKTKLFMLRGFLDQYPNPDNRITLSAEKDKFGIPKANVSWAFTDNDKESVLSFFKTLDHSFRQSGLGYVEYSAMEKLGDWPLTGIHSHFMGTTRMGADPRISVTDQNACVHGVENLYISGPSLFTTYGFANPVLTISALALRLADHISARD